MMRAILLLLGFGWNVLTYAQRAEPRSLEETQASVHDALTQAVATGELGELARGIGAHGTMTVELTIDHKGRVESLFVQESTIPGIPQRNQVKDHVKNLRFDLALPKGKRYQFTETITLP